MKKRLPPLEVEWSSSNDGLSHWAHVTFLDYDGELLRDSRVRTVGARLRIEKSRRYDGVVWEAWPHATRQGSCYGPVQPTSFAATLEAAKDHLERYARAAHARMARKFGKAGAR